ncbi:hemolysin III family protein [Weeksellaceae bacterium TAE3-ERU29]|nr:hemolysin III family protein [Weeksellaceae bacterium TAE3-ERU29]
MAVKDSFYTESEEKWNVITHFIGLIASLIAFPFLIYRSINYSFLQGSSFIIYGISLILLYSASTFYHNSKNITVRRRLNILDHISIYILIAGTYSPYLLVTLQGKTGWTLFTVVWGIALIGTILKLFFTGRFNLLSTILYVGMGWVIVSVIKTLLVNLDFLGVFWLFLGGIFYTIGAVIFMIKNIKFNHVIFHVFVLLGSLSHYISIYFYV